ncbi:MAG TPA: caspase-like domain-containing protein, partial [Afipia sp.]|nr:caspase-like domain-containing protein [Afipia sp.]
MRGISRFFGVAVVLAFAAMALPLHAQTPPPTQGQQSRIALVIGNGNYQKAPLATAANDAGLIAQTLQAAGFDVVGARDLDGETLRQTFGDFIRKAQAAGPDTVAFVYLAGYGLQLAGENYFAPVDANMVRDTDVPVEGLRVGDYIRQLSSLPLKGTVVVLDAAYNHPFAKEGQPLAGGLALIEPDPKSLIAFNAAPGTVAPNPTGNYGPYAQALAEMMRTGGISLPEVFNRVRLRVNDVTKGAQVPWDAQKFEGDFVFFERAPDAPPLQANQDAAARSKPIRDFSAQEAYTAALERDTIADYEAFLAAYPDDPMAKRVRAIIAARREAITWRQTYRANTQQAYWSYLKRYPRGPHAADARRRLANIAAALEPPPAFDAYAYDVPPPPEYEYEYVDRPYLMFDDPVFGFAPPPPPPIFFLPPPPEDFVVLDPPYYYDDAYYLPQPVFVPIPIFIRPPIYVRPPINRFLFTNIHNTNVINTIINRRPSPGVIGTGRPGGQFGPGGQFRPGRPGGPGGAATTRPAFAPALPPSATRRANLIRQGKVAAPPGVLPGAGRPGGSGQVQPGQVQPGVVRPGLQPGNVLPGQGPGAGPGGGRPGVRPLPSTLPAPGATGPQPGQDGRPGRPDGGPGGRPGLARPSVQPGTAAPSGPAGTPPGDRERGFAGKPRPG